MKVLIIDDEPPVRESIRLLIPWEQYEVEQVLEACNGAEALQLIQTEKPQIVFTDIRMPGMDGIEVLKWISEHEERIKAVIISGYNDFDYVRSALKYGSFDYILKPIDELELLEVFEKALASWRLEEQARTETQQMTMRANQYKPMLADNMFSRLLQDPDQYQAVARTLRDEYNIGGHNNHCRVAVISLGVIDYMLRRKFSSALDLLVFSITNICNEILFKENNGIAFQNLNEKHEIVILLFQDIADPSRQIKQIQDALLTALRSRFYMGIGRTLPFPQGLSRACVEARMALKHRNLLERFQYEHYFEEQRMVSLVHPLTEYEDRLFLAIRRDDQPAVQALLIEWGDKLKQLPSISIRELELWWQEFVLMHSKWCKEAVQAAEHSEQLEQLQTIGAKLEFQLPLNEEGELSIDLFVQQMMHIMEQSSALFMQSNQSHVIFQVEQHIRAHYSQDIQLQQLASEFYLSPSHISRTFKQQFGENITDFVARLRIERAKVLLADPELKISTIAAQIGYLDEKYFSKAFKRFEGVSPNQFRKLHLK